MLIQSSAKWAWRLVALLSRGGLSASPARSRPSCPPRTSLCCALAMCVAVYTAWYIQTCNTLKALRGMILLLVSETISLFAYVTWIAGVRQGEGDSSSRASQRLKPVVILSHVNKHMHLASLLHLLARLSLYSSSHTNELRAKTSNASGSQGHRTTTANESKLDDPCTMVLF